MSPEILSGIVIGGAGGAIAGITVYSVQYFHHKCADCLDGKRVYKWLQENDDHSFRSTRAIASHNNLTIDRVRFICSKHEKIYLSTGKNDDMWSIHTRKPRGFFDDSAHNK